MIPVVPRACPELGGLRNGGGPASGAHRAGIAAFHTTDRGSTAVNRDRALWRAGLRVLDPLFATTIPVGRRSSCPAPLAPGGQPDPRCSDGRAGVGPLRWARCPDDGRLYLLQLAQVLHAAAGDDTRARWLTFALERVARVGMVELAEPDEHELARVVLTDTGLCDTGRCAGFSRVARAP